MNQQRKSLTASTRPCRCAWRCNFRSPNVRSEFRNTDKKRSQVNALDKRGARRLDGAVSDPRLFLHKASTGPVLFGAA